MMVVSKQLIYNSIWLVSNALSSGARCLDGGLVWSPCVLCRRFVVQHGCITYCRYEMLSSLLLPFTSLHISNSPL